VKGLDVSLLQQNKARAAQSTDDDDSLEQAFQEVSTESRVPQKRTREDIIKELKEKRQQGGAHEEVAKDEAVALEEAKKAGTFKPIGFKPIGTPAERKTKKKKGKDSDKDGERKKKKRKIEGGSVEVQKAQSEMPPPPPPPQKVSPHMHAEPEPEPIPEDFDIFAGAGDYVGIDLGDDDDEGEEDLGKAVQVPELREEPSTIPGQRWFADDEDQPPQPDTSQVAKTTSEPHSPPPPMSDEDEEPQQPTRLVPLQTSAIPSIRDLLAMDGAQDKRKKRKGKNKGGKDVDSEEKKKVTAEARADRDYKRLKSYTEKKAGASSSTG
jgi:hypothetical protein